MTLNEFSRRYSLSDITRDAQAYHIEADAGECAALAHRFGLAGLDRLEADFTLQTWRRNGFRLEGGFKAQVKLICVITLDEFNEAISCDIERCFLQADMKKPTTAKEAVDLDIDHDEPDILETGHIDAGEIVAETLCLALPAHPRKPHASFETSQNQAQDTGTDTENPFAVLKNLQNS